MSQLAEIAMLSIVCCSLSWLFTVQLPAMIATKHAASDQHVDYPIIS